jgi:VanZ family protein
MNYKYLILAVLSTLFVIYMSSRPGRQYLPVESGTEQLISNLAHIPVYAVLTFLWLRSFVRSHKFSSYLIIVGILLVSIFDEVLQSFIPGRTASINDVGLNLIGIILGIWALNLLKKSRYGSDQVVE